MQEGVRRGAGRLFLHSSTHTPQRSSYSQHICDGTCREILAISKGMMLMASGMAVITPATAFVKAAENKGGKRESDEACGPDENTSRMSPRRRDVKRTRAGLLRDAEQGHVEDGVHAELDEAHPRGPRQLRRQTLLPCVSVVCFAGDEWYVGGECMGRRGQQHLREKARDAVRGFEGRQQLHGGLAGRPGPAVGHLQGKRDRRGQGR